jgi:hypothetical protein
MIRAPRAPAEPADALAPSPARLPGPDLDSEVIVEHIQKHRSAVVHCYELERAKSPTLAGRVVTRLFIGRDGRVRTATDGGSDPPLSTVAECVRAALRRARFPARDAGGTVDVVYPVRFTPP